MLGQQLSVDVVITRYSGVSSWSRGQGWGRRAKGCHAKYGSMLKAWGLGTLVAETSTRVRDSQIAFVWFGDERSHGPALHGWVLEDDEGSDSAMTHDQKTSKVVKKCDSVVQLVR